MTNCTELIPTSDSERSELGNALKLYLQNEIPASAVIEIISASCGSLDVEFTITGAEENYTNSFESYALDNKAKFEWRNRDLTLTEVTSRLQENEDTVPVEEANEDDDGDDEGSAGVVIGILFGLFAAVAIIVSLV